MFTGSGFAGREAIFRECGLIKHVLITETNLEDSLFVYTLFPLSSPGFSSRIKSVFKVSVDKTFVTVDENHISASVLNWCLVTNPDAIAFLTGIGNTTETVRSVQDAYIAIRRHGFAVATSLKN
jgi:hypothetical protein